MSIFPETSMVHILWFAAPSWINSGVSGVLVPSRLLIAEFLPIADELPCEALVSFARQPKRGVCAFDGSGKRGRACSALAIEGVVDNYSQASMLLDEVKENAAIFDTGSRICAGGLNAGRCVAQES